jgi:hypothetical protein
LTLLPKQDGLALKNVSIVAVLVIAFCKE